MKHIKQKNLKTNKIKTKEEIENVCCPFCGQKIKGEIPKGLTIKEIEKTAKKIIEATTKSLKKK